MEDKARKNVSPTFLGPNIKFLRKLNGHSQSSLAERIGVSRSKIATYESGAIEPRFEVLIKLSDFFNEGVDQLLSEDLATRSIELAPADGQENIFLDEVHREGLQTFVKQTTDMERVLEGYRTFYTMQSELGSAESREFSQAMSNMFELLQTMIDTNWKLIRSFHGYSLEEE